jgi:AcrR family transcriptional regulator
MATNHKYRHGDVHGAALRAAREAVAADGAAALSLRAIARTIGVTHAALYRHFPDREALLVELGIDALQQLAREQESALARHDDPVEAMEAVARAYFRFAVCDPGRFRSAFVVRKKSDYPMLRQAADAVERPALLALERAIAAGRIEVDDVPRTAAMVWALTHGLCTLAIDGQLTEGTIAIGRGASASLEQALLDAIRRLLRVDDAGSARTGRAGIRATAPTPSS